MKRLILGIDTSCYTSSCALAGLLSDQPIRQARRMLPVALGERGLRQSEAVFAHIRQLPQLLEQLTMDLDGSRIAAVCVSEKPLDLAESYMPVFQAGVSFAKAISNVMRIPCYLTTHQRGHLAAAQIGQVKMPVNFIALHLSGGTTQMLLVKGNTIQVIGDTGDVSAGQLIDRVGVAMGLPFPAGLPLENLARKGQAVGRYPSILKNGILHLSGAESAAMRDIQNGMPQEEVAAEVFDLIARCVIKLILHGDFPPDIQDVLLSGGVASSSLLKQIILFRAGQRGIRQRLHFSLPEYSGDNAAGVAMIGKELFIKEENNGADLERE